MTGEKCLVSTVIFGGSFPCQGELKSYRLQVVDLEEQPQTGKSLDLTVCQTCGAMRMVV